MKRLKIILTLWILTAGMAFGASAVAEPDAYIPKLIEIEDEAEIDSLRDAGTLIWRRRGDILLCLVPNPDKAVPKPMDARKMIPALDRAKGFYEAYTIQNGQATGTPYTGKGVVVGICDIGFDPSHPTFLDADGNSRIRKITHYVEGSGIRAELEGEEAYRKWVTDNPDMYHATHVCGILAGNGAGSPYSGIATEADIVVSVSTLSEVGLLAGVEDIIDYAREVGKPAVVNISVGCYVGPHDGTSLYSRYLDMCADEAIIVTSSGNEGLKLNSLLCDFPDGDGSISFRLGNREWTQFKMYGCTELWNSSAAPLSVGLHIYDCDRKVYCGEPLRFRLGDGETVKFEWNGEGVSEWDARFEGRLMAEGLTDRINGRHLTALGYDFISPERSGAGGWARYELAVEVSGESGDDLEVYADGTYTRLVGLGDNPRPTTDRSISDLACGFKVVSVGMYGNRDSVPESTPAIFGDQEIVNTPTGYQAGETVIHSSYGTLRDGRVLPVTVAPGAPLMSACSRPFISFYPLHPHLDLEDPWMPEPGTSMSSPYVAGYIATWLEAVPTLTSEEVIEILHATNRTDIPDPSDPRNATGYFDPVAGLRLALKHGGVESVRNPGFLLHPDDRVEVYNIAGTKIYAGEASGLSGIEKGMYVVRAPSGIMKARLPMLISK